MRYNPSAEVKAYRNENITFDKTKSPLMVDIFEQMGEQIAVDLISTHLLNYTTSNMLKLPDGDPKMVIVDMSTYVYEKVKFWSVGELMYFFYALNGSDTINICTKKILSQEINKFNQLRSEKRRKIEDEKEKQMEEQLRAIKKECWIKAYQMNLSEQEADELYEKMVFEKLSSLNSQK